MINEIVQNLGPILAVENLPHHKILDSDIFKTDVYNNTEKKAALLLVALKVLPKLPYYLVADKWRLQQIETPSEDVVGSWWKLRQEIQGVSGNTNQESDFLGDSYINSNRPEIG